MDHSPSHEAAGSTCFSGLLRRLLCSGAHPTHPSDVVVGGSTQPRLSRSYEVSMTEKCGTSPGIIARLMGLDSLPETDSLTRRRTLESILRSRSVNSVNYVPEFDLLRTPLHRRAKTSVSFREVPTFINEPDHEFVVLCFERVRESKGIKSEIGFEKEMKQREAIIKRERNRGDVVRSEVLPPRQESHRRNRDAVKAKSPEKLVRKRRRKKKRASVNNFETFSKTTAPPREPRLAGRPNKAVSSSRRSRTTRKDEELDEYPCQINSINNEQDKPMNGKGAWDSHSRMKLVEQIQSLSEEHITSDSQWRAKTFQGFQQVEEICNELGQQLLDRVVDELLGVFLE